MDLKEFNQGVENCLAHLKEELSKMHAGRANPDMVEDILVEAYGAMSPLKNVANIAVSDSKSLVVQPWDKSIVEEVGKAISAAKLGFSPIVEGDGVRVMIPDMTEERRTEFIKMMNDQVEEGRVAVRQVRQKTMQEIEDMVEAGMSEDDGKRLKTDAEKKVKEANEQMEEMRGSKEEQLTTI